MKRMNRLLAIPAFLGMTAAGCVDDEAGALLYSGRAAVQVGFDRVTQTARADVGGRLGSATLPDSLRLEITGLPVLSSGEYQLWVVNEDDGAMTSATRVPFTYQALRPDTVSIDPFTGAPTIEWNPVADPEDTQGFGVVEGQRNVVIVHEGSLPVDLTENSHIVVTAGTGDANPADAAAPLFYRFRDADGDFDASGDAQFGFRPSGLATGAAWAPEGGGRVEFVNTFGFGAVVQRAVRPPVGYYYALWLYNEDTGENVRLGDLATPGPEFASLRDADIERNEFVAAERILDSGLWASWEELGRVPDDFTHVVVTLESKAGDPQVRSPMVIYRAIIPGDLDRLPEEKEGLDDLF